jgi:hypothetical protein
VMKIYNGNSVKYQLLKNSNCCKNNIQQEI